MNRHKIEIQRIVFQQAKQQQDHQMARICNKFLVTDSAEMFSVPEK